MSMKSIVDSAFEEAARQAILNVIARENGYGLDSEIKDSIREVARDMTKNDPEIRKLIRDQLIYWIAKP